MRNITKYISSDSNVWIDFDIIKHLELPFALPCVFLMSSIAFRMELRRPGLVETLVKLGLQEVSLTEEEITLASELVKKYTKPSLYDCMALAIAKVRNITLLTGDGPLRKAAAIEGVQVVGTIGILDQLKEEQYISQDTYQECIASLLAHCDKGVRLPKDELIKRLVED